jgi:hypothetical protein
MKIRIFLLSLICSMTLFMAAQDNADNDSTGLAGDNFSLEGALMCFKESESPEDFESKLNAPEKELHNLDLNGDGTTDYLHVIDKTTSNAHAIIIRVQVSESETQDVAVIEIEKDGDESALLQIVGDEELYGEDIIVEPADEAAGGGKGGPAQPEVFRPIVVNIWGWKCVRFIYAPAYALWVSPWRWNYYPNWYRPWRTRPWHMYHNSCSHYRVGFRNVPMHRVAVAHACYRSHRTTSAIVHNRYKDAHQNHQSLKAIHLRNDNQPVKKSGNLNENKANGSGGHKVGAPAKSANKSTTKTEGKSTGKAGGKSAKSSGSGQKISAPKGGKRK